MRLLLDTHALVWWLTEHDRLSRRAFEAIRDPANRVWVSAVSMWELAIKISLGKFPPIDDLELRIERALAKDEILALPVTMAHAFAVRDLPLHHRDPFDRLLLAQAAREKLTLVSNDRLLRPYAAALLW